ncbi:MAG TPA: aspartyl protease family protein [Verrucomicrobiae bacterium]|nr:aspartyl protease family protein [Verrucomicrobiae bacterium]
MKLKENPTPYMGEVRTRVRLLNIADASAVLEGRLSPEHVRVVEADALVDTGAIRSCVPASLMERLGIRPYNQVTIELADGHESTVGIADGVRFEIMDRRSGDDALILGDEVLIGQTLLEKMDLLVDCSRQRLVPAHPGGPISKLK